MAEERINGIEETDPYSFDLGKPFFADNGTDNTIDGVAREVPIFDPSATASRTGPENESRSTDDNAGSGQGGTADFTIKRPRGRPRGSTAASRTAKKEQTVHLTGWDDLLFSAHILLANMSDCPELELTEQEAQKINLALDRLAAHYNVVPSVGQQIWAKAIGAFGSVYGPKFYSIYKRKSIEKPKPSSVVPIRPIAQPPQMAPIRPNQMTDRPTSYTGGGPAE